MHSEEVGWRRWAGQVIETVYPHRCAGCERRGHWVCPQCEPSVPKLRQVACERCGAPTVADCLCPDLPGCLLSVRSAYPFSGWVRTSIHWLKFEGERARAAHLAHVLAEHCLGPTYADLIVPVPLHPKRLRERGFNQSGLLAMHLGRRTGIPWRDALLRQGPHIPQVGLHRDDRRVNVAGAFVARSRVKLEGLSVIVIDDVVTTASTVGGCAEALVAAGARSVRCVSIARPVTSVPESLIDDGRGVHAPVHGRLDRPLRHRPVW